ncbi:MULTISPECIES: 3,4-dihydroxy-2-butanone-4-phosphate synthase [Croceibacter]|jgi:3,4-dihydroxy 2-butanone 4-phosphate synthase/GTP cyclohydrolase II|uniref:3,4-dihydroxy-2-butanone 4-phosphate synthase n=1 Tax=Croceibacter atlanticus (strain ATCC BAA-628 / JCM 21780 / CIP 108009 / IAM 15332 / KCTC 12090 / HTCC2559) TaxID=216432 RepID=A3U7X5_CROAH|nr:MULTISPECIES: 3,4-dihydroxy-2-butanone-4-phosphate synthase [Croceibacter]EAP88342.1 putative riboflavin biosynthesis protein [Croceibacter atlanticus HTCC2559]MAM22554.1 3,4-dihydroxy-2-butanone-4-phosphate synthase [Croceibacter sp.]MBG26796.1 3,4-dihydroxy-2-butanone-4-phosphate synthase [Croceibacter sp.]MBW4969520.1 3,4-dihydroxy-2-butanone-4-phosphate synthase [Croceibacter atlanticus]WSP33334.1 3,4-dihydroxy-2-butanone-4-phosphate synthase [Croceibacter atlanticus]|tara:strand:+ start:129 stop:1277 length:1149 start_codon:yes stop_codon:yes gene_type:complete
MSETDTLSQTITLNTIEEAIADVKAGKVIIVVDDQDRENEGDFLAAAEAVTPEMINFMATHGRGLICAPLSEERCSELNLNMMVGNNTDPMETAFTISVDLKGQGVTTGISASDRAKTVQALIKSETKPYDLSRPGHIFPLKAKEGGVLRRTGHTEAAIDFARLAGFQPAGVIVEIMNEDGTMARLPQLVEVAKRFDLKLVSIEDLVAYRMLHDSLIEKKEDFEIETRFGSYRLRAYKQTTNDQLHLALTKGTWEENEPVLVRVNSTLVNNDILGTLTNNADKKLDDMFKAVNKAGKGAIVFINQESQALNLLNRLSELKARQKEGEVKAPPIQMDQRDFGIGAQILHDLGIHKINLLSNSTQQKRVGMIGYGLEILDYVTY